VGRFIGSGKTAPQFLHLLLASRKLNELHTRHFTGLSFGGLHPPQYGLQDQHMVIPPIRRTLYFERAAFQT